MGVDRKRESGETISLFRRATIEESLGIYMDIFGF